VGTPLTILAIITLLVLAALWWIQRQHEQFMKDRDDERL